MIRIYTRTVVYGIHSHWISVSLSLCSALCRCFVESMLCITVDVLLILVFLLQAVFKSTFFEHCKISKRTQ